MPNVSLVIAEARARCMDSLLSWRRPANQLVVLTQHADEPHCAFRGRVTERLARFRHRGERLDEVMLVAGSGQDGGATLARAQMLGSVFAQLDEHTRISLDAGSTADPVAWRSLQSLAETVAAGATDTAPRIELRRDDSTPAAPSWGTV